MEAPARRRRARLRAAFVALTATCSLLFTLTPAAYAEPDPEETTAPPTVEPTTEPPPPPSPTVEPTTEAPPPPPPPTTTTEAPTPPPKLRKFSMSVSDVVLGDPYWQGDGASKLVISVQNTGEVAETITGFYTFPSGTSATGAYGTDGCVTSNGTLSFSCPIDPGRIGHVVVEVQVAPDAWRLTGGGNVTAVMENYPQKVRNFSINFSTAPPVPGIELTTVELALPAQTTPHAENASLQVKLRNSGSAKAAGAIEVVTPPGVDVVSYPAVCKVKKKLSPERDRCELGDIPAGKDIATNFVLSISPAARAELPLTGALHGFLAPIGRDAIETRTDYKISGPPLAGEAPLPTEAPASPPPTLAANAATDFTQKRSGGGILTSEQLSSLPFVGGIVGLVALVGFFVVFSLRRRLRDEPEVPAAEESLVTVPPQRKSDENLPPLPTRSPIPRSLTLPRLPNGPVAGSGFRDREE